MGQFVLQAIALLSAAALQPDPGSGAVAAMAETTGGGDSVASAEDKPAPDKKVCKRAVVTGSIMPKVTCRTARDWNRLSERSAQASEKLKAERESRDTVQTMKEMN